MTHAIQAISLPLTLAVLHLALCWYYGDPVIPRSAQRGKASSGLFRKVGGRWVLR